jgi:hypothetical protein
VTPPPVDLPLPDPNDPLGGVLGLPTPPPYDPGAGLTPPPVDLPLPDPNDPLGGVLGLPAETPPYDSGSSAGYIVDSFGFQYNLGDSASVDDYACQVLFEGCSDYLP